MTDSTPDLSVPYRLAKAYADLGTTLYNQNQYEQARQHFQQALDAAPDLPASELAKLHCNIGLCWASQTQLEEARRSFMQAQEIYPDDPQVQFHLDRLIYEEQNHLKGYNFWQDGFSRNMPVLRDLLHPLVGQPDRRGLVIGGWDGRPLCWLLEHVFTHPSSALTCIARFELQPSDRLPINATQPPNLDTLEPMFRENLAKANPAHPVEVMTDPVAIALRACPLHHYDLIYIDDSHRAQAVLTQAVLSWDLLKPGGLLVLDYYDIDETYPHLNAKLGIDAFLLSFSAAFTVLHRSHLVILEKSEVS